MNGEIIGITINPKCSGRSSCQLLDPIHPKELNNPRVNTKTPPKHDSTNNWNKNHMLNIGTNTILQNTDRCKTSSL